MLAVEMSELETVIKRGSIGQTLFNLVIESDNTKTRSAMIKEMQQTPIAREILHVDFYEVDMDRKIRVRIPVVTTGKAMGVELGGTLQLIRRELEVLCYPGKIPESIVIDVTELGIGESIHVEEIPLEGDIEIPAEVNFTVLAVLAPKVEAEEEEEEEAEEGEEGEEEAAEEGETGGEEE
jgi:large subunit ribosomal protein L25